MRSGFPGLPGLALFLLVSLAGCQSGLRDRSPDLLLITVDTLRADHLGCYGAAGVSTPTIDGLAAEGLRFDLCQASAPITLPSHATILTGQLPIHHGVHNNGTYRLPAGVPTVAGALRDSGYETAAFVAAFPLAARFGLARGFDHYDDELDTEGQGQLHYAERPATEVLDRALSWLRHRDGKRPVFVWVHVFEPHAPYKPRPPFDERFAGRPYDGEIASVDAALGPFLEEFNSIRGSDRLTVVTADHGEGLGEHGEPSHAFFLYQSTLRVPLIFHEPGRIAAGGSVASPVSLADLAPTILDRLGVAAPEGLGIDGIVLPLDGTGPGPRALVSETLAGAEAYGWSPAVSMLEGEHKLILSSRAHAFDLRSDPGELSDLSITADWVEDLVRRTEDWYGSQSGPSESSHRELSREEQEQLAALGYAGGLPQDGAGHEILAAMEDGIDPLEGQAELEAVDRARARITTGDFEGAIAIVDGVLDTNPDNVWARELRAGCLREAGRQDEALEEFERVVSERPLWFESKVNLARLQVRAGRLEDALLNYDGALSLAPLDSRVFREAIQCARSARRPDLALGWANAARDAAARDDPKLGFIDEAIARLNWEMGTPAAGLEAARSAVALRNDEPAIHYLLLALLEAAGEREELARALATAHEKFPHDERFGGELD